MTVSLQSTPLDDFGGIGRTSRDGPAAGISEKNLHPHSSSYKKPMTLEEAMGDIKPLELSPESIFLKEKELQGAKIIDGKAIAK